MSSVFAVETTTWLPLADVERLSISICAVVKFRFSFLWLANLSCSAVGEVVFSDGTAFNARRPGVSAEANSKVAAAVGEVFGRSYSPRVDGEGAPLVCSDG